MRLDMAGIDELAEELMREAGLSDDVIRELLYAGAEEVKKAWQASAESHRHRDTGAMIESIAADRAIRSNPTGGFVEIYPRGTDGHGVRNAQKAYILNYGTSKLKASHWVEEADANAEEPALEAMREVWDNR